MSLAPMTDDEWLEYVSNGEAYTSRLLQIAVPGQVAHVQLFNPVGSGKRIRVRCWEPFTIFSIIINQNLRRHDVPLAVLGFFGIVENLLGGGAANVAEGRTLTQVGAVGLPFWLFLAAGSMRRDYPTMGRDWGQDLLPGQGLMSVAGAGAFVIAGLQWAEVDL